MNKQPRDNQAHTGSVRSYIIGFILSLEFTAVPYALVQSRTVSGNALWMTILGIGILQMLVQILFFLHLGRGPKPWYNVSFYIATVGIILVVAGGTVIILNNLERGMSPASAQLKLAQEENIAQVGGSDTGACQEGDGTNYRVTIRGGKADVPLTVAKRCDTLTFINTDPVQREISFGKHPDDSAYGGEKSLQVSNRRPQTITLNQKGTFMFHDHFDPKMSGLFTVNQ